MQLPIKSPRLDAAKGWLYEHPKTTIGIVVFLFLFITLPAWFGSVWQLFTTKPFFVWLAERVKTMEFSAYWITAPIGVLAFLFVLYLLWSGRRTAGGDASQRGDRLIKVAANVQPEHASDTQSCPDKRVHRVADTQAQHIDHYVILKKIVTGDQQLTADVPSIVFSIEVRNESIFDISIDMDVENGYVYFAYQLLAERKILRYKGENIPPRSTGTITFEQRLSTTEAALIFKNLDDANINFHFDRLIIYISGGTDYPQVTRKSLDIPKDIEVNEASPEDLKARVAFLTSELATSEGRAEKIKLLKEDLRSIESQLFQRVKITRALSETMGYGKALYNKCQASNMEYPKDEVDEWASRLWDVLRGCFEENDIEKFYSGIDERCPGYERGVARLIKVPEANAERHLWFHYHLKRLYELITEQFNATTIVHKEEGQP